MITNFLEETDDSGKGFGNSMRKTKCNYFATRPK